MVKAFLLIFISALAVSSAIYQSLNMQIAGSAAAPGSLFSAAQNDGHVVQSRALEHLHLPFEQRFLATAAIMKLEAKPAQSEIAIAEELISGSPQSADTQALRARLDILRGDHQGAFAVALQARQMDIVNEEIDTIASHDLPNAIRLQESVVRSLEGARTQREALADAYWRLGALENLAAERGAARLHRSRARNAFEANVKLTPLSGRALLSAGYAELALGAIPRAKRCFRDAIAADPSSASAYVGLARIAIAEHDHSSAAAFLQTAQRLAPDQSDVRRLRNDL